MGNEFNLYRTDYTKLSLGNLLPKIRVSKGSQGVDRPYRNYTIEWFQFAITFRRY